MQTQTAFFGKFTFLAFFLFLLTACSSGGDSVSVTGDVSIAYVKRPVSALGNPTDSVTQGSGGDLYVREKASPSAPETNITRSYTGGTGDVSDPEVSYDGNKILFAMRRANERWSIFEYDTRTKQTPRKIACDARDINNLPITGDDVDPAYLPDGRIVFSSNRQETTWRQMQAQGITPYKYTDEYEREAVTVLHTMNADGTNCKQISFNQSHDRNPTVLSSGKIMYSRWDHVGVRNQFSIFKINPDGTDPFILYGAHDLDDIYLHPREMPDGRLVSTYMPLSRTREGGSLEIIDYINYSANNAAGSTTPPANQLGVTSGQFQATRLLLGGTVQDHEAMRGQGVSPLGRYSTPYPLWDGSNRMLVVYTPSQPTPSTDALGRATTIEGQPQYGIYMFDLDKRVNQPILAPEPGYFYSDPVALQARPANKIPRVIGEFTPDTTLGAGMGLLDVNTAYDTDSLGRMGPEVLEASECIPRLNNPNLCVNSSNRKANVEAMKHPANAQYASRVARFFRITKAVPTPGGMSRQALGETEFEMQQILGYGVIEPDGSIRTKVPANTPINITALDSEGRAFTPHTNWLQAREGERRFCKGCHSSRLGATPDDGTTNEQGALLNTPASYQHPAIGLGTTMANTRTREIDPSSLDLKPNLVSVDIWTPLYNTRDGSGIIAQPTISIDYSLLTTTPPTIKGSACGATWGAGNVLSGAWSSKDCAIVINYVEHIQPILDNRCASSCHNSTTLAAGIDLSSTAADVMGRAISYQRLLVGEPILETTIQNGQPVLTPVININADGEVRIERETAPVIAGSARSSRLIERLSEKSLKAAALSATTLRAVCATGATGPLNGATCQNHSAYLNRSEKRLITEWIDLGALYYNDPHKPDGSLRSNAARLSETVFTCRVKPVLEQNCMSCHQPFANGATGASNPGFTGNRFILTGNGEADFNVTASMVTNVTTPADSYLLARPSGTLVQTPAHPAVLPTGSTNYNLIRDWISNTLTCP